MGSEFNKNLEPDNTMPKKSITRNQLTKKAKSAKAMKAEQETKPDFILLGLDVHLNKYVVRRQVDGQGPQPAQTFRSMENLLKFMAKQVAQSEAVYSCYEAGPLGYGLHRQIKTLGINNYVVKPRVLDEEGKRRKTDKNDALGLVRDLDATCGATSMRCASSGYQIWKKNGCAARRACAKTGKRPAGASKTKDEAPCFTTAFTSGASGGKSAPGSKCSTVSMPG